MDEQDKARIRAKIEGYVSREYDQFIRENTKRGKRKNQKPENLVVKDHLQWYEEDGFFMNVYESKAKAQLIRGQEVWRTGGLEVGTPDSGGTCPNGYSCWIEFKAKGSRSRISNDQRAHLTKVIERGGFGLCSDDVNYSKETYHKWLNKSREDKIPFLLNELPKSKAQEDDLPF